MSTAQRKYPLAHHVRLARQPHPWTSHAHEFRRSVEIVVSVIFGIVLVLVVAQLVACNPEHPPRVDSVELRGTVELATPQGGATLDLHTGSADGSVEVVSVATRATVVLSVGGMPATVVVRTSDRCVVAELDYVGWHLVQSEPPGCEPSVRDAPPADAAERTWAVLQALATVLGPLLAGLV